MQAIKAKRADVAALIAATFPEYRGRTYRVCPATRVRLDNLNWCGGSRSQYRACTLAGESVGSADKWNTVAPWVNKAEGAEFELPQGAVMVEHQIFCGKDMGLRFYIRPEDMPARITAAA